MFRRPISVTKPFVLALALGAGLMAPVVASAAPKSDFEFAQIGADGKDCKLVMSGYSNKPVTRWDRKKGSVLTIAIGKPGECPKTYSLDGSDVRVASYPSYSIANRVFTAVSAKGDRMVFYRAYGDRYNFRWIKAPQT